MTLKKIINGVVFQEDGSFENQTVYIMDEKRSEERRVGKEC